MLFHRVDGKKFLETIGRWERNPGGGNISLRDAIEAARTLIKEVRNGRDPRPMRTRHMQDSAKPGALTVAAVIDQFVKKYVEGEKKLRSGSVIETQLGRLKPAIGHIPIMELKRRQINDMLDEIEEERGPRAAGLSLSYLRKALNWFAARDDDFINPIVRGMNRGKAGERDRILDDAEIRDLWSALEIVEGVPLSFPPLIKFILLTATRQSEAADIVGAEIDGTNWVIPARRYKTGIDHTIVLSPAALALLGNYGRGPIFGDPHDRYKKKLDAAIAKVRKDAGRPPMEPWVLHDLRRSARSLMSRAGVLPDIGERCLGHKIAGVRGVYDRHEFLDEKRDAFAKLAAIVAEIVAEL